MALRSFNLHFANCFSLPQIPSNKFCAAQSPPPPPLPTSRRRSFSLFTVTTFLSFSNSNVACWSKPAVSDFIELPNSGGVKCLDLRIGDAGDSPSSGDTVVIHYYGRLAAKQGWRFDSTYDHKDENGEPLPFQFVLGSGKVISGIESAVRSMKVGGIRRVVIPPSQGYQNMSQQPIPPDYFDRQRLFTTIFNPTRLANGEGSTLGTLIFDIELVSETSLNLIYPATNLIYIAHVRSSGIVKGQWIFSDNYSEAVLIILYLFFRSSLEEGNCDFNCLMLQDVVY